MHLEEDVVADDFVLMLGVDLTNYPRFPRVDDGMTYAQAELDRMRDDLLPAGTVYDDPNRHVAEHDRPTTRVVDTGLFTPGPGTAELTQPQLVTWFLGSHEYLLQALERQLIGTSACGAVVLLTGRPSPSSRSSTAKCPRVGCAERPIRWASYERARTAHGCPRRQSRRAGQATRYLWGCASGRSHLEAWATQLTVRYGLDVMFDIQFTLWGDTVLPRVKDLQLDGTALPGKAFDLGFEMPEPEVGIMTSNRCVAVDQWEGMGRRDILEKNATRPAQSP